MQLMENQHPSLASQTRCGGVCRRVIFRIFDAVAVYSLLLQDTNDTTRENLVPVNRLDSPTHPT